MEDSLFAGFKHYVMKKRYREGDVLAEYRQFRVKQSVWSIIE